MRKVLAALLVAVFVAPAFAGSKPKKAKSQLPAVMQMAINQYLAKRFEQLDICKVEMLNAEGELVPCADRLVRVASGREAGFAGRITGHTLNGELPVTIFVDSDEYIKLGQIPTEDARVILASSILHEVCHGFTTDELTCYSGQVTLLQNENVARRSPIVDRVISTHLAHIEMCQAGNLPGCEKQVSSAATSGGVQTAAQR